MKGSVTNKYPNAWDFHNTDKELVSTDNRNKVEYYNLNEIAMGAPLGGECFWIDEQGRKYHIGDWCGGPPIWDIYGTRVAIPTWTRKTFKGTVQQIVVLDIKTKELTKYKKIFSVLDFKSFKENEIFGYDSPIHNRKTVRFELDKEKTEEIRRL